MGGHDWAPINWSPINWSQGGECSIGRTNDRAQIQLKTYIIIIFPSSMVNRNFSHQSSRLAPRFGRFRIIFLNIYFIFLHVFFISTSYRLQIPTDSFIFLQHLGPKRGGEGGRISRRGSRKFYIYPKGGALEIFSGPTKAYDWSKFPTPIITTHTSLR